MTRTTTFCMRAACSALLLAAVLLPTGAGAATRAWLDRDTVTLGETVTLNVETDQIDPEVDFSALKGDFELLGTSSRTQVNMGSGGRSISALRAVALEPRRSGTLTIPSLAVGSETTDALQLTVLATPAAPAGGADQDVFLEIDIEPRDPYVQQQVRYTLRLFYAVTLLEGQLEEPAAEHIEVRRLGQDRSDQRSIDGRRYNVVERHYALIPERSGTLAIPPAVFRGRAILPGRRSTWIGAGSPVAARGREIALQVRPRPDGAPEPWLPAADLVLEDASGEPPASIRVGEPLTLTYRARARGLGSAQLPDLELSPVQGADVYPDQPVARDANEGAWLIGERERKFAIVPQAAGPLHIPALEIQWWDVDTDSLQTARVGARTVEVLPASGADAAAPPPDTAQGADGAPYASPDPWRPLALALAILWLVTLAGWWWQRRWAASTPAPVRNRALRSGASSAQLKSALAGGDLAAVATAVREQARQQGLPVRSLGEIAAHLRDADQAGALRAIEAARFGEGDPAEALALARIAFAVGRLATGAPAAANPAADEPLPPLYPR